ncbi:MAG: carbohydrate kinase family protein [Pyrinomonadaceae bacterium]
MNFPFKVLPDKEFDAVGFGTNAVDYLIRVPEYPAFNSKMELETYIQAAGGEAASTMAGLQRLGMKTAYVGRFGSDREGEFGLRSLTDEGVDVSMSERVPETRTQVGFILIDGQSGERTVLWQRDKKLAYTAEDAPAEAATRCKVLHITPHDTRACIKLAAAARSAGAIVSMDIDKVFEGVDELLPLVDICIASADFPGRLLGVSGKRSALREIRSRFGCSIVGLTLGISGSIVLCDDTFIETPAFEVPGGCIDTTGAGDAFRTGFLHGMLSGASVEESGRAANAVAALKCRGLGARTTLPTQIELKALLKNI